MLQALEARSAQLRWKEKKHKQSLYSAEVFLGVFFSAIKVYKMLGKSV